MQIRHALLFVLILVLSVGAVMPAFAASEEPPEDFELDRFAFYTGISGMAAIDVYKDADDHAENITGGLEVFGGINMYKHFATEVYGSWLEDDVQLGFGVVFKGRYPIGRFVPYAGLGVGLLWIRDDQVASTKWGGQWIATGGVDIYLNRNFALDVSADYRAGTGTHYGRNYVTVGAGVKYVFGK